MSRCVRACCLLAFTVVLSGTISNFSISTALADSPAEQVRARIDALEFGPALELANGAGNADERNALRAQIAQAQFNSGAGLAAADTLRAIDHDGARSAALGGFMGSPEGNAGGEGNADFDSLMELIETTIAPDSWESVGGRGAMAPFPTGVYVDPLGVLREDTRVRSRSLASLREAAAKEAGNAKKGAFSALRKVSLTRLEREVQLRLVTGQKLDEEMLCLAGIERVQYVFVYPETGDLVIAGPAADWGADAHGRLVSAASGRPLPRLEDFVVVLRAVESAPNPRFGCSITPTQESIQRTQKFLDGWSTKAVSAGGRGKWLKDLQAQLGRQQVSIHGIDPATRAAAILVEADRHMKLVGIGLEDGVAGVTDYLTMAARERTKPKDMNVLRWWFTLDYEAVETTEAGNAFALRGQGVRVLSENELLAKTGERIHPGTSDELTSSFANQFTSHFDELAVKYPVYAELQNIFDLSMVAAILRANGLADRVDRSMAFFENNFPVQRGLVPREVDTVLNHKLINGRTILAAISGGVDANPIGEAAPSKVRLSREAGFDSRAAHSAPLKMAPERWWWD